MLRCKTIYGSDLIAMISMILGLILYNQDKLMTSDNNIESQVETKGFILLGVNLLADVVVAYINDYQKEK